MGVLSQFLYAEDCKVLLVCRLRPRM